MTNVTTESTIKEKSMDINKLANTLGEIHSHLFKQVSRAINISLTIRNWLYGYYIQEYELNGSDRAKYGEKTLENLSKLLKKHKVTAASHRHLKLCRQFYQKYSRIGQTVFAQFNQSSPRFTLPLIGQIPFAQSVEEEKEVPHIENGKLLNSLAYSHFVELVKISESLKRSFYEVECVRGGWSVRELKRQIESLYYERSGLSKNKIKLAKIIQESTQRMEPYEVIRDPYIFEFLDIKSDEVFLESRLADSLIDKFRSFLLELGKGFCFEARNKRIIIGDEYFFIDLVFYHRILKCHVLIELKTEKFNHENIGQLNAYLNYYKKNEVEKNDNPPIGILLCTEKNHALVEYALGDTSNQLFVSKYKIELPSEEEVKHFIESHLN